MSDPWKEFEAAKRARPAREGGYTSEEFWRIPREDQLLPDVDDECEGCGAHIAAGSKVMMVPIEFVEPVKKGIGWVVFCGKCPMPEKPL